MKRWEYMVTHPRDILDSYLIATMNAAGEYEGWELVTVIENDFGFHLFWKREKAAD